MAGLRASRMGAMARHRFATVLLLLGTAFLAVLPTLPAAAATPLEAVPIGWGEALNLTLPSDSGDTPLRVQVMLTNEGEEPVRVSKAVLNVFRWMGGTVDLVQPDELLSDAASMEPGERLLLETTIVLPEAAAGNFDAYFHVYCRQRVAENDWTGDCSQQFGFWRLHIDRVAPSLAKEWAALVTLSLSALTVGAVYALWHAGRPRP